VGAGHTSEPPLVRTQRKPSWYFVHTELQGRRFSPKLGRVHFHTLPRITALETEVLVLSARKFVTVCYVACEHLTSATNNFQHYWRYECLSRPRRFVTFYISTLEIFFTYLLTYLISLSHTSPSLCLPLSFLPFFFSFSFLPPSLSFSLILTSLIPVHHSHQIQL